MRCIETTRSRPTRAQCRRNGGYGPDYAYCRQHAKALGWTDDMEFDRWLGNVPLPAEFDDMDQTDRNRWIAVIRAAWDYGRPG